MRHGPCLLLTIALVACAQDERPATDPFAAVIVEDGDPKADSIAQPTSMGALPFDVETDGELSFVTSGYHLYTLRAQAGWGVRVLVSSQDFKPYVRVTARHDRSLSWSARGDVRVPDGDEPYLAILDVMELPTEGEYDVLVTSITNMSVFPLPVSWGAYELWAETDVVCPLDGGAEDCPETLTCRHEDGDPEGMGTCVR